MASIMDLFKESEFSKLGKSKVKNPYLSRWWEGYI